MEKYDTFNGDIEELSLPDRFAYEVILWRTLKAEFGPSFFVMFGHLAPKIYASLTFKCLCLRVPDEGNS